MVTEIKCKDMFVFNMKVLNKDFHIITDAEFILSMQDDCFDKVLSINLYRPSVFIKTETDDWKSYTGENLLIVLKRTANKIKKQCSKKYCDSFVRLEFKFL